MPMRSEAQRKWMWANKPEMAKRWEAHTPKGKKLPEKVAFITAFSKVAVVDLSEEARYLATVPMQDYVKGQEARKNMDTGQARGRVTRTEGVQNEDREMKPSLHHKWKSSRAP